MWSKELQEKTREEAYPGAMMKKLDGSFGMMKMRNANGIKISGVKAEGYMPVPTNEIIAEYKNLSEMIADGWAID